MGSNVAEFSVNAFIRRVMLGQARTVQFESSVHVIEGSRIAKLKITRSSAAGSATADYYTRDEEVIWTSDFNDVSGTVTFHPGSVGAEITIPIVNDRRKEGPESFSVVLEGLSSGWNYANGGWAQVFIEDED